MLSHQRCYFILQIVLYSDDLYNLFKYVEASSADIAADAFASFKELLTRHKSTVAEFLEANYDRVSVFDCILLMYTYGGVASIDGNATRQMSY